MKNLLLAAILTAAPPAAQIVARVRALGPSVIPGLGASFDGVRLGAAPLPMPTQPPGARLPALSAPALAPALAPTAGKPVEASLLGVIRDDAADDETQGSAALERLFENSAPPIPETLPVSAPPVAGRDNAVLDDPVNGTVEFYSRLTLGRIRETSRGGIEMTATRPVSGQTMFIRWHSYTGFDFIRSDGFYYFPSRNHLRGVRLSLLRTMRDNGPPSALQLRMLEKLDAEITGQSPGKRRGEVL